VNYSGKFDAKFSADGSGPRSFGHFNVDTVQASHVPSDAIIVPNAHLLFNGDYKKSGLDLVLSKDGQELVLHDYFKGEKRAPLASPDGAHLTGDIIKALSGHVEYAQADGSAAAAKVIGHVTKLEGSATCLRNGVAIILNNGDNVEKGDVVQTGTHATLGITFIDGTVFGLLSNSRMVLNEMVYDPNGSSNSSLLSLVAGTITFVAGETAKHGDMKVDTPVATMGIRGTAVLTEIDFQIPLPPVDSNIDLSALPPPVAKFQVLVEPDGTTGSYILYDKTTLTQYATVDKAGQQINISGGQVNYSSEPLPPDVQKLIQDVFSLKFTDNSNTKTTVVQNDSIVPKDGSLTFKLPDGATATAIFANLNNGSNGNGIQNNLTSTFFVPQVKVSAPTAQEKTPITTTGGDGDTFTWQVSKDGGVTWTTVSTAANFTPSEDQEGMLLQLLVTGGATGPQNFSFGAVQENPSENAAIKLDGLNASNNAVEGTTVTATVTEPDAPSSEQINYTWMIGGKVVASGAGLNTFTPTGDTEGQALTVTVSFTDIHGFAETGTASAGTVIELPEAPNLTVTATHGAEGGLIALNIVASGQDADDNVTINISGVPSGAALTDSTGKAFTANSDGSYTLTTAQLNGLQLDATKLEQGQVTLHVTATNNTTGEVASISADDVVTVDGTPETPNLTVTATHGAEGGLIALNVSASGQDVDDSVVIKISGVPEGSTLTDSQGHPLPVNPDGSYTLTPDQLSGLQLDATNLEQGQVTLHVLATNTTNGEVAFVNLDDVVTIDPAPEAPNLTVTATHGAEAGLIALNIVASGQDADDNVTINISGVPSGATLTNSEGSSYTPNTDGSYTLTPDQLNGLQLDATKLEQGQVTLHVTATNNTTGEVASNSADLTVTVDPIQENPAFGGATSTSASEEGGLVTLAATVVPHDSDDGTITVTITGLAHDLTNFSGGTYTATTGSWTGTATDFNALTFKAGEDGVQNLTITATTSGAEAGSVTESYKLTVNAIQENPIFGGATSTSADEAGGLVTLGATVGPHDGDDGPISVTITGLAHDLSNFSGGTYTAATGSWTGTATQFNALTFNTGEAGEFGVQSLTITATTSGPEAGSSTESYALTVNPISEHPIFGGATSTSANEEGGLVTLGATVAPHDVGQGPISVTITGLAHDLSNFNGGTYTASNGSWTGTAAEFNALTFKTGEDGVQTLTITATASDPEAGSTIESYTLTVKPIQENPIFSGATSTSANEEGGLVTLGATVVPHDGDDGTVTVKITGLSNDLTGFNGGTYTAATGTWTGTATDFNKLTFNAGEDGLQNLTITATTSGAEAGSMTESYTLTVNPVAEAASLAGTITSVSGNSDTAIALTIVVTPADTDDNISIQIAGVPSDAVLTFVDSHGTTQTLTPTSPGVYTLTMAELNQLKFIADEEDQALLHVTVTSSEGSSSATSTTDIAVSVDSHLLIPAGQTFHINGDTLTDHTVDVEGTLIGFGTVTGSGGALDNITVGSSGLIEASSSHTVNLHGNITGTGTLELTNNTSMEIGGSVASTVKVLFDIGSGSVGELILDDPNDFHATINGFNGSDIIDLKGLPYSGPPTSVTLDSAHTNITVGAETFTLLSMTSSQTVIKVSEGAISSTITLAGNYTSNGFVFSSDGSGGTQFHDPVETASNPAVSSVIMNDPGPSPSDTIVASAPNQTLTGLAANDTFVFNFAGVGNTTVTDFHPETDLLQFKSSVFANAQDVLNATHDDGHGNAVIAIDPHDSVTLSGVIKAQLHTSDFHVV
jgi:fibronectin-binding autotransporter adhesin